MLNILLAAASQAEREQVRTLLAQLPVRTAIYEAETEAEALHLARTESVSLFVLDTSLRGGSGLHCAAEIRKLPAYRLAWMVFFSQYADSMLEAYRRLHCYDFLIKPYDAARLRETVRLLLEDGQAAGSNRPFCLFRSGNVGFKVYEDEILFLEVSERACTIHTSERDYHINRMPLKEALRRIHSPHIVQTHKSYAANLRHIRRVERYSLTSWNIYFDGYDEIALLGNKYKDNVLSIFAQASKPAKG